MDDFSRTFDGESLITPETIGATDFGRLVDDGAMDVEAGRAWAKMLLDTAAGAFVANVRPGETLRGLMDDLHVLRASLDPVDWAVLIPEIQAHHVASFIHQDPFTHWSFRKPRGYSGDAGLLDFIYGHADAAAHVAAASDLGRVLMAWTTAAPASAAVRERREILARLVDETAERLGRPIRVLTIASGHLREAELSQAMEEGRLERWVALDQDPESVAGIARAFPDTCIEPVEGSVRGILKNEYDLGTFDLVYAAGLYDYLPERTAVALTSRCLDMLAPGGSFLFANFADVTGGTVDDAFMETFMNWLLIFRTMGDVVSIMDQATAGGGFSCRDFSGENGNILYGVVSRLSV